MKVMPIVSSFYGIIIRMFFDESKSPHHLPHFHAVYAEHSAVYSLEGKRLEGKIPKAKERLILAWVEIHKDELSASWQVIKDGEVIKIEGLR